MQEGIRSMMQYFTLHIKMTEFHLSSYFLNSYAETQCTYQAV